MTYPVKIIIPVILIAVFIGFPLQSEHVEAPHSLGSAEVGEFIGGIFGYWVGIATATVKTAVPPVDESTQEVPPPTQTPTPSPTLTMTPTPTPTTSSTPTSTAPPLEPTVTPTSPPEITPFVTTEKPEYYIGENLRIHGVAAPNATVAIQVNDPNNAQKISVKTMADHYGKYSTEKVYTFTEDDLEGGWLVKANWFYQGGQFTGTTFNLSSETSKHQELANLIFQEMNELRESQGLRKLVWDAKLAQMAYDHSEDMALKGYLDHDSPEGITFESRLKLRDFYPYHKYGETILMLPEISGFSENAAAKEAVANWHESAGHREIMLDLEFTHVGIGVYINPQDEIYITADYMGV